MNSDQILASLHPILTAFKVRGATLDLAYMHKWATHLQVSDLLERALSEAGLSASESS